MKVLLDSCMWSRAKEALEAYGHDVTWVGEWEADPGDAAILARAHREGRVLITLDKDFGELATVQRKPHAGIIRLTVMLGTQQVQLSALLLANYEAALAGGAIITADLRKIRIRFESTGKSE